MKANIIVLFFFVVATATPNVKANDVEEAAEQAKVSKARRQLAARRAADMGTADMGTADRRQLEESKEWRQLELAANRAADKKWRREIQEQKEKKRKEQQEKQERQEIQKKIQKHKNDASILQKNIGWLYCRSRDGNVFSSLCAKVQLSKTEKKLSKIQEAKIPKLQAKLHRMRLAAAGCSPTSYLSTAFPENDGMYGAAAERFETSYLDTDFSENDGMHGAAAERFETSYLGTAFPENDEKRRRNISIAAGLSGLAAFSIAAIALICWTLKKQKRSSQKKTVSVESSLAAGGNS